MAGCRVPVCCRFWCAIGSAICNLKSPAGRSVGCGSCGRSNMVKAGIRLSRPLALACGVLAVVAVVLAGFSPTSAQVVLTGQNAVPAYEGWELNPDGSFNLVFGYFNRNWEEEL